MSMYGKDLLPAITAASKEDRFSKNLMEWVQKHKDVSLFVAYSRVSYVDGKPLPDFSFDTTCEGSLYIGLGHDLDDGWLHGARLSEIICQGAKSKEWAFPPKKQFVVIPDWWEKYISAGKCCIDPEHKLYIDKERWLVAEDSLSRRCEWCGKHEQRLHTEMVPKTEWR